MPIDIDPAAARKRTVAELESILQILMQLHESALASAEGKQRQAARRARAVFC